jgi:hypothetical protein
LLWWSFERERRREDERVERRGESGERRGGRREERGKRRETDLRLALVVHCKATQLPHLSTASLFHHRHTFVADDSFYYRPPP